MTRSIKLILILLTVFSLTSLQLQAQNFRGSVSYVAAGTPMQAVINETISSEFTRPGERLTLSLGSPVYSGSSVALPAGALVEAEVIEASPAGRAGSPGKLDFRLTAVITPDGGRIPLSASLDQNRFSLTAENHSRVKHYAKATVAGAAGGALSGLIGGAISGGRVGRGTALGTAVGSGVGILGGTLKKGKELTIAKGTPIPFILDRPLQIGSAPPPSLSPQREFGSQRPFGDPSGGAFQPPSAPQQGTGYYQNQNPYY
ncbi:MAG: hypothetical protein HRT47_02195 [Candidatus Caenarcaniphilales bacterium]|nr:hypothetical protein [Candidatus Caenarcaniphilales bacterium]